MSLALLLAGCGGKVLFDGSTGTGGAGGHPATDACVTAACNAPCSSCVTQSGMTTCSQGKCDQNGICQPPSATFACGI